jgi:alkanesulfonate monooxygenase SsuD/methylene tetrahydromethanopterin reductase-like flavin-dependent oxidoreductase (luciferase family)
MSLQRPLAFGLTPMETRHDVVLHVTVRAEELGYSVIYVGEGWGHDVSVLLAEIAMHTSRIRIATGILNVWGRSAASIAMLATSLANLSGGRFVLGLGAGSPQLAEGLHGVPFRSPIHRLDVVTRDVRALMRGERPVSSPPGEHTPMRLAVNPQFDVPVHLAALGAKAVRLCGELARWVVSVSAAGFGARPPHPTVTVGTAVLESGRPLPLVCPGVPAAIASDPATARRLSAWWITFYLTKMGPLYSKLLCDLGHTAAVAAVHAATLSNDTEDLPSRARGLIEELTLCGSAESARADLDRWYHAGADMPVVMLLPKRDVEELDYALDAMRPQ